jgi:peptide/nickel transport system substrate-binding protein
MQKRVFALLAAIALVASACGGGSSANTGAAGAGGTTGNAKGSGGTLRIAMSAGNIPFPNTPPNEGYEGYRFVGNNVYDGLTRLNLDQSKELPTPQPALAESWERSADDLTWTFHLRKGVTFTDGTPFNADAVIFQYDRMKKKDSPFFDAGPAARGANQLRFFASWAKVDDSTITITTTQPYAWLLYDLAHVYYPSPTAVKTHGVNYQQNAVGTGPFKIAKYVDGEVMELVRNPDYWRGPPKLDKIVLLPMPEPASRQAALQAGEADWAEVPSPDALDQLKADGNQVFMNPQHPGAIMPRFNLFRPPFKDNPDLRKAVNYALDREGIVKLLNGVGVPATQYVYKGHPAAAPVKGYSYDPVKAKEYLAKAGYKPGELKIRFAHTTGGSGNMYPSVMTEKFQADLRKIGIEVELVPMEWNTLITVGLEGLNSPKWADIDLLWASPAAGMTPTGYVQAFLCNLPSGAPNAAGYCNPDVDADYKKAAATFDEAAQNKILQDMMGRAVDDAAFVFWMQDTNLRVMTPKVHGYVHPRSWWVDFTKIWVEP